MVSHRKHTHLRSFTHPSLGFSLSLGALAGASFLLAGRHGPCSKPPPFHPSPLPAHSLPPLFPYNPSSEATEGSTPHQSLEIREGGDPSWPAACHPKHRLQNRNIPSDRVMWPGSSYKLQGIMAVNDARGSAAAGRSRGRGGQNVERNQEVID